MIGNLYRNRFSNHFRYSIFDLDRTFFRRNVSFAFYFYLLKNKIVPLRTFPQVARIFVHYWLARSNIQTLHHHIFQIVLKGLRVVDLERLADCFLQSCEKMVCPKIREIFISSKSLGHKTFLLSSSPDFLVARIARKFLFDQFAGTEYGVDKEGRLCEISLLINGLKKKEIARQWIKDSSKTIAYSDSFDDVDLLEWAGLAVAVRPDRRLKKHALQLKWRML